MNLKKIFNVFDTREGKNFLSRYGPLPTLVLVVLNVILVALDYNTLNPQVQSGLIILALSITGIVNKVLNRDCDEH